MQALPQSVSPTDGEPGPKAIGEELRELFRRELELCRLTADETLAIAYTADSRTEYVLAARAAAESIGSRVVDVSIPAQVTVWVPSVLRGMGGTATLDPASEARIKAANMLLDVTAEGLLWSPAIYNIVGSGVRAVMAVDPPEALQRMFPSPELKRRVQANMKILADARTMHVTSAAGTDVKLELGQYEARGRWGFADEPGHWDHWPSGMVATYPNDASLNGVVVVDEGDVPLPFMRYVSSPVRLEFEAGRLISIEGGLDARLIREFIESWDDPGAYLVSHVGWGLQRRANWAAIALFGGERMFCQDIRTFEGNFLISTGPNEVAGRFTPCHFDLACRDVTVRLDGKLVLDRGVVVPDDLQ